MATVRKAQTSSTNLSDNFDVFLLYFKACSMREGKCPGLT